MQEPSSKAYFYAMEYIHHFPKTESELASKMLTKKFKREEIEEAIEYLKFRGYLDDAKFAEGYVESQVLKKKKSPLAVKKKLQEKWVDSDTIAEVFRNLRGEIERASARGILDFWEKEAAKGVDDEKILGKLARRGYGYDTIKNALAARMRGEV